MVVCKIGAAHRLLWLPLLHALNYWNCKLNMSLYIYMKMSGNIVQLNLKYNLIAIIIILKYYFMDMRAFTFTRV